MRKWIIIPTVMMLMALPAMARHIKGGEISYTYLGPGASPNTESYLITLRLFLECNASGQQLDPEANIGIFLNSNQNELPGSPFLFPLVGDDFINLTTPNPCITSPSPVCYRLRTYTKIIDLPIEPQGYSFVFQRCCRINGLVNLNPNNNIGSSYVCRMGGSGVLLPGESNSSPAFAIKDTVLICQQRPFTLDFSAYDPNGDSLSYEFCDAYTAAQGGGAGIINPVPPSQIGWVNYATGFSGSFPLGARVQINPSTGLISGVAPGGGDYVISVCVKEWRHGRVISEHRKDFNILVDQRCDLAAAVLKPTYTNCDSFTTSFQNESPPSTLIHTYFWDFGVPGLLSDTSNNPTPTYRFPDTGVYRIRLYINKGEDCTDSTWSDVRVFPGFFPGFTAIGSCVQQPFQFTDTTRTRYGQVDNWQWSFGDETSSNDVGFTPKASWKYSTLGLKPISLIVTSNKGCIDTVYQTIEVRDKPIVNLAFRDTLICSIDSLQLMINGPGNYSWRPNYNIINPNLPSPIVYPKTTTTYLVDMNDNGCVNTDSVKVRVVDFVTLNAGPDSTICLTDTITLKPFSDGLKFSWTPTTTLINPASRNPKAFPTTTTTYRVTASIGKCNASDDITIRTVPYPGSFAGKDTLICYEDTATLFATIKGSSLRWTPSSTLSNPFGITTRAWPITTTRYTLAVFDTLGCPKPGLSSVLVNVNDRIIANAGNDTSVVVNQPLQLNGLGAELFEWNPPLFLNNPFAQKPVATLNDNMTYILKAYTQEGCFALDTINIKVFKTAPDIFVPNAFSPGGRNRVLRPIPVGIARLEYFRVFNRWGQLVYQTSQTGQGWDGTIGGVAQGTGTYVWQVRGKDFTGKTIIKQGTALLVR